MRLAFKGATSSISEDLSSFPRTISAGEERKESSTGVIVNVNPSPPYEVYRTPMLNGSIIGVVVPSRKLVFLTLGSTQDAPVSSVGSREKFSRELIDSFVSDAIDDGQPHPAEKIIENSLKAFKPSAIQWVQAVYNENVQTRPVISSSILRCLGRLHRSLVHPWVLPMAVGALSSNKILIREASVRALESWGEKESLSILIDHADREPVSWLKQYIKQVITDLSD